MANKQSYLGEFEYLVLLSVASLGDNAYGVTVRQHLKQTIDRDVAIGALYATAERLEKKGMLSSYKAGAKAERGGKAKRYFNLTALGRQTLLETRERLEAMWQAQQVYLSGVPL